VENSPDFQAASLDAGPPVAGRLVGHGSMAMSASPRAMNDRNDEPDRPTSREGDEKRRLRLVGSAGYSDWDEIYIDNVVWMYRLLYSRVGNRPDAEDLTTEVFMAALGPLRITATRAEVRGYLAATSRTVLARYWRRRLGVEVTVIDPELAVRELDDPSTGSMAPTRARAVLATLPERHRRVLELRFLEARSVRETAREMGISVANAKVLQHRALRLAARARLGGET
jgi:RNA polymerase sigma factor (sigma-70 family)